MQKSPYAPPQANVVEVPRPQEDGPLQDMGKLTNAELRELLCNPDLYIAEAVHQAAKELASRKAVPRYYTRLYSQPCKRHFFVNKRDPLTLPTKLRIFFSESNLIRYCLLIAIVQAAFISIQVFSFARLLKAATMEILKRDIFYFFTTSLGLALHVFTLLFFLTLYRTLSIRSLDND